MLPLLRLRKGIPTHNTALAMVSPRAGDAVLILGGAEPALAAAVGQITGLNGRTVAVVEATEAHGQVETAAAEAGTLVDIVDGALDAPVLDPGTFDVVVVSAALGPRSAAARRGIIAAAVRAARPGKRLVVIEGGRRRGWLGAIARPAPPLDEREMRELLDTAGLLAVRLLGTAEGQSFFEGRTPGAAS